MIAIYKLISNGCLRYIGITKHELVWRLTQHLSEARRSKETTHRLNWLRSLAQPPEIELIELASEEIWKEKERYWISLARDFGCNLVNTTEGGDGVRNLPEHSRAKMRAAHVGKKRSPETRERMSAAAKRRIRIPLTPQHCEAISAGKKGKPVSLATRAAQLLAITGRSQSLEHRAKIGASLRGKSKSSEHIAAARKVRWGK